MPTEMQALVWEGPRQLALHAVPRPEPRAGEALVRVGAAGICGSELEGYLGLMQNRVPPLVMGHEFAGEVVAAEDTGLVGRRVAVNPLIPCGECAACRAGRTNVCERRAIVGIHRPGAFAELVAVPAANLLALPDGMSVEAGALVEPLANVLHAVERGWRGGSPSAVLVLGAGSLGLLAVQACRLAGAPVVVAADVQAARLELAAASGATHTLDNAAPDAAERLRELLPDGPDVVIDCVGARATKRMAVEVVRSAGTIVLLGLHDDTTDVSAHQLVRRELTLAGSYTYTDHDVERALELLASGAIRFEAWTTVRPLAEGPASFSELVDSPGRHTKILLVPDTR